jgi:hypothetical protein
MNNNKNKKDETQKNDHKKTPTAGKADQQKADSDKKITGMPKSNTGKK